MAIFSTSLLRRLAACVLLLTLSVQAMAAVTASACLLPGGCPMQMQMQDMPEAGCEHEHAAPSLMDAPSHLSCDMDHCPLMAAPAMLGQVCALFVGEGRSPQQTLTRSDFYSIDPHGLLRPPRLSA